jgi:hypothetical protein
MLALGAMSPVISFWSANIFQVKENVFYGKGPEGLLREPRRVLRGRLSPERETRGRLGAVPRTALQSLHAFEQVAFGPREVNRAELTVVVHVYPVASATISDRVGPGHRPRLFAGEPALYQGH